jgi:hypothetical protein
MKNGQFHNTLTGRNLPRVSMGSSRTTNFLLVGITQDIEACLWLAA